MCQARICLDTKGVHCKLIVICFSCSTIYEEDLFLHLSETRMHSQFVDPAFSSSGVSEADARMSSRAASTIFLASFRSMSGFLQKT